MTTGVGSSSLKRRAPFGTAFLHAMAATFIYAPAAVGLALVFASLSFVMMSNTAHGSMREQTWDLFGAWLVIAHAAHICFMTGLIGSAAPSLAGKLRSAGRACLRAIGPVALLIAGGVALTGLYHKAGPFLWAAATFFAAPSHFARHGWSGWWRPMARMRVAWPFRLLLVIPSTFVVAVAVLLLTGGGSWGFMQGGLFIIPAAMGSLFWASFGCALLSAEFAQRLDDEV